MSDPKFILLEEVRKSDGVKFTLLEYKKEDKHHVKIDIPRQEVRNVYFLSLTHEEALERFKTLIEDVEF